MVYVSGEYEKTLTMGKTYEVANNYYNDHYYEVIENDDGYPEYYMKDAFVTPVVYRDQQLKKILT